MTHYFPYLLAANWNELISVLFGLVFLVFWVVSQIADAKKKQAQQAKQAAQPKPPPARPADQPNLAKAAPAALAGGDPLRAQVDEFLRRAAQPEPQPQKAKPAAARRDAIEVLVDESAEPVRAKPSKPLRPTEVAAAPQPRRKPPRRQPAKQSVAEHVASHVNTSTAEMREEVSHLGEAVIAADREFDAQLEQKFSRQLGSMGDQRAARVEDQRTAEEPETPAAHIAAMLANPAGVRQAIIINEILRRPDERW